MATTSTATSTAVSIQSRNFENALARSSEASRGGFNEVCASFTSLLETLRHTIAEQAQVTQTLGAQNERLRSDIHRVEMAARAREGASEGRIAEH